MGSLNTRADSIDQIIEEIRKKYSKQNVITSGIQELDHQFLNTGFQPSRVYMFAGTSGVGKSLLLLNMAIRAALSDPYENQFFNLINLVGLVMFRNVFFFISPWKIIRMKPGVACTVHC